MAVNPASVQADNPYTIRMFRKSLDAQKQEGEAAVSLIESAGEVAPRPEGEKGHILSTIA